MVCVHDTVHTTPSPTAPGPSLTDVWLPIVRHALGLPVLRAFFLVYLLPAADGRCSSVAAALAASALLQQS
jgi:hypothetical protein